MDDFDRFWQIYPRKIAKGDARKAWKQTEKIRPPIDKLIKAVIVARATEQWRKDGGAYVPYPATWLRGERWDDCHEVELDQVRDGKAWNESVTGIERIAQDLGMSWSGYNHGMPETYQQFTERVRAAFKATNVIPIARKG